MSWDDENEDDETATAWHEAGHAVIGFALGGKVESMALGGEADDVLPDRFGDCIVNWGPVDGASNWQRQREIMTLLAGPVGEMIYLEQWIDPATMPPWQFDWELASQIAESLIPNNAQRMRWMETLLKELYRRMDRQPVRAAIAAVADELLAHEYLESDRLEETIGFWLRV